MISCLAHPGEPTSALWALLNTHCKGCAWASRSSEGELMFCRTMWTAATHRADGLCCR